MRLVNNTLEERLKTETEATLMMQERAILDTAVRIAAGCYANPNYKGDINIFSKAEALHGEYLRRINRIQEYFTNKKQEQRHD